MSRVDGRTGEESDPDPREAGATSAAAEGGDGGGSTGPDDGVRWLNDEERAAWLANSAIMVSLPAALDARMQRESGMTFFEYMVLSVLSEEPDRTMQMSALAVRTAASLSRLSHVVGRLEKRGLITRARIPGLGRRTNATLTDAGFQEVVAAAPGHVAAVREYLIDGLEHRDIAALGRIGRAVEAAIDRGASVSRTAKPESPESFTP
ncbi:MarR family winged helix-turn-helix transcriptional regulator [Nocardiopsis sp. MG754419]|uniref:MarR family winged helix-turn-helix transcriptional regulator n=1 Tax=Nocardiopsis sp. MG754419 TaxID=2259865 RepID=UPI001BA9BDB8|nr:MarR family winged helix-turn-helix transcriptional regulator [Nocardiopsis sp. MG754419]MBR8742726.1 MarR family transcriptional regulator [Nocardiopsis sp. MG754419]